MKDNEREIVKALNDEIKSCLYNIECNYNIYNSNLKYAYQAKANKLSKIANLIDAQELRIEVLEKQLTNGWIQILERLPEEKGWYLVCMEGQRPYVAYFKGKTFPLDNHYHKIIAWQPIPLEYKEDTNAKA